MAGADRIHTSGLHDLQLALRGAPVDGSAKSAEIMMQADTMQLAALAIQQKTSVLVSNAMVRTPNVVVYLSTTRFLSKTSVTRVYR